MEQVGTLFLGLLFVCSLFSAAGVRAQENEKRQKGDTTIIKADTIELNDRALIVNTQGDTIVITSEEKERIIPRKAALFSAALPGLGQAYNGSYWKIPIIYGIFSGLTFYTVFTDDRYQSFRRAYIAQESGFPELNPYRNTPFGNDVRRLNNNVERLRRERDRTYIFIAGAYALQIMEAIVDAHLQEFDMSNELALDLQPSLGQVMYTAQASSFVPALGATITLKIK
ncbi:MAG: DUF5683 domain-containing protein [Cyclobacteriaceae bacterium]